MKYKTLVMKQIDQHTYQYSMNAPLDHLSPILSFDEEILEVNFGNELEYALNCKVLMSVDKEMQEKYSQEELIRNLFQ